MSSCSNATGSRYANLLSPQILYVKPNDPLTCPSKDVTKLCAQLGSSTHPATLDEAYALAFTPEYVHGNVLLLGSAGTFGSQGSTYVLGGHLSYQFAGSPLAHVLGNFVPPSSSSASTSQCFLKGVTVLGGSVSLSNKVVASTKVVMTDVQILNSTLSDTWIGLLGVADGPTGLLSIRFEQSTIAAEIGQACIFSNPAASQLDLFISVVTLSGLYQGQNLCEISQTGSGTTKITSEALTITFPDGVVPEGSNGSLLLITATAGNLYRVLSQTNYETGSATVVKKIIGGTANIKSSILQSFRTTQTGVVDSDDYSGTATVDHQCDNVTRQQLQSTSNSLDKVNATKGPSATITRTNSTDTSQTSQGNAHSFLLSDTARIARRLNFHIATNYGVQAVVESLTATGTSHYRKNANNVVVSALVPSGLKKQAIAEYDEELASTIYRQRFADDSQVENLSDSITSIIDTGVIMDLIATGRSRLSSTTRSCTSRQNLPLKTPVAVYQCTAEDEADFNIHSEQSATDLYSSAVQGARHYLATGNAKISRFHTNPNWKTTGTTTLMSESTEKSRMRSVLTEATIDTNEFSGPAVKILSKDSSTSDSHMEKVNVAGTSTYAKADATESTTQTVKINGASFVPSTKEGGAMNIMDFKATQSGTGPLKAYYTVAEAILNDIPLNYQAVVIEQIGNVEATVKVTGNSFQQSIASQEDNVSPKEASSSAQGVVITATDGTTMVESSGNSFMFPNAESYGSCYRFSGTNGHCCFTNGNLLRVNGRLHDFFIGDECTGKHFSSNNDRETLGQTTTPADSINISGQANYSEFCSNNCLKTFVSDAAATSQNLADSAFYQRQCSNECYVNAGAGKTFQTTTSGSSTTNYMTTNCDFKGLGGSTVFHYDMSKDSSVNCTGTGDSVITDFGTGNKVNTTNNSTYSNNPTGNTQVQLAPSPMPFEQYIANENSTQVITPSSINESYSPLANIKEYITDQLAQVLVNETGINVNAAQGSSSSVHQHFEAKAASTITALNTSTNFTSPGDSRKVLTTNTGSVTLGATGQTSTIGGKDLTIDAVNESTVRAFVTNAVITASQALNLNVSDAANAAVQQVLVTANGIDPTTPVVSATSLSTGKASVNANVSTYTAAAAAAPAAKDGELHTSEAQSTMPIMMVEGTPGNPITTGLDAVTFTSQGGMGFCSKNGRGDHSNVLFDCAEKAYDLIDSTHRIYGGQLLSRRGPVIGLQGKTDANVGTCSIIGQTGVVGDLSDAQSLTITTTTINAVEAAVQSVPTIITGENLSAADSTSAVGVVTLVATKSTLTALPQNPVVCKNTTNGVSISSVTWYSDSACGAGYGFNAQLLYNGKTYSKKICFAAYYPYAYEFSLISTSLPEGYLVQCKCSNSITYLTSDKSSLTNDQYCSLCTM